MPAVSWRELPGALRGLCRSWRLGALERLTVGSTGIWRAQDRTALRRGLRRLARRVRVMSDLELAHAAAFGREPGIIAVAGTGSVAYGRDEKGRAGRAGGLGPLLGDEGSGFWLGRQALKDEALAGRLPRGLALRIAHSKNPVRRAARLAREVLRWAPRDRAARAIRGRAAQELARLAAQLGRELHFSGPVPLSWHGSLFRDPGFRSAFLAAARKENPRFRPRAPGFSPEIAAAALTAPRPGATISL